MRTISTLFAGDYLEKRGRMKKHETHIQTICLALGILLLALSGNAQTTAFPLRGDLPKDVTPATDTFEMQFRLLDAATGGTQIGATNTIETVEVKNRAFGVELDFGAAAFPGADRFIEIGVRLAGSSEPFTIIAPRTRVLSVPYAIRSLNSTTADNALNLGGVDADDFVQTTDTRLSDSRNPNPGSNNYIQNTTIEQTPANFNISGNGTAGGALSANLVNSVTQYNLAGVRILSAPGTNNTFTGLGSGAANTSGQGNAFYGSQAGGSNSSGSFNAIFGSFAGVSNTSGIRNAFFGTNSGRVNTTGNDNSFFGTNTGFLNTTGVRNAFFGSLAGVGNTEGDDNSFFGANAGFNNSTGFNNSFFGANAGLSNTTGNNNSFFGRSAGSANTTGNFNAIFGSFAGAANTVGIRNAFFGTNSGRVNTTGNDNSFFGTNTGFNTTTGLRNSVFGSLAGVANTEGDDNAFFGANAGANSTASNNSFFGANAGLSTTTGDSNSFFGTDAGRSNQTGNTNAFFGRSAGRDNTVGSQNVFIGFAAGVRNTTGSLNAFVGNTAGISNISGSSNSFFGASAGADNATGFSNSFFGTGAGSDNTTGNNNAFFGVATGFTTVTGNGNTYLGSVAGGTDGINNASAIGFRAFVSQSNSLVLGGISGVNGGVDTNVGIGTTAPADRLDVDGIIRVSTLGAAGVSSLCRNALNQISDCSSSLRYKTDIAAFDAGMDLVNRLQPITFKWRDGGMLDIGLGAEDVAAIEPLLVNLSASGKVEGVKYDRIGVLLLNAAKEQQAEIDVQRKEIADLRGQVEALKKMICATNASAELCATETRKEK